MAFPYRDPQQAQPFILGYFERLRANDEIRKAWLGLEALVQVRLQEPDVAVLVDTRGGQEMRINPGIADEEPGLTLSLSADSFHAIYTGQVNVFTAFAERLVRTEGNAGLVMQTAWTLPQAIQIYREHCAAAGVPELRACAPGASRCGCAD